MGRRLDLREDHPVRTRPFPGVFRDAIDYEEPIV